MTARQLLCCFSVFYLAVVITLNRSDAGDFDRLADGDRKVFHDRFVKEVWPLLQRNGKDGCVGCHNGKLVSALKLSGNPSKDFHFLLREGFFDYTDRGSLLARVIDKDQKRRMPPHPRESWKAADVQVLRAFMREMDAKQRK